MGANIQNTYWGPALKEQAFHNPLVPLEDIEALLDGSVDYNEQLVNAVTKRKDLTPSIYSKILSLFEMQNYLGKSVENKIDILINGITNTQDLTQSLFDRCFDLVGTFTNVSRSYRSDNPIIKIFQHSLINSSHFDKTSDVMMAYIIAGTSYWPDRKAELVGMKLVIESGKMTPNQLISWMDKIKNSKDIKLAGKRVSYTQSDLFDKLTGYILEGYSQATPEVMSFLLKNLLTFTSNFETLINHSLTPIKDVQAKTKYKNEKVSELAKKAIEKRTNASTETTSRDSELLTV
jgi:hypothetical protein